MQAGELMEKTVIRTEKAPIPVAPYSQAIKAGGVIYVSGFVAFDPRTGKVVQGGIREQATQVMENIKAVLEAAGSSMKDVEDHCISYKHGGFQSNERGLQDLFLDQSSSKGYGWCQAPTTRTFDRNRRHSLSRILGQNLSRP